MTPFESEQQIALGQIRISMRRLVEKYPFHVKTLERFVLESQPQVGTMGVTVADGEIILPYNPAFVRSISIDELGGLLLHQVHHLVFGHPLMDPAEMPDEWARTIAEEVTVNEFITEPLPGVPMTVRQFPDLKPGQSTRERYERLKQRKNRPAISTPRPGAPADPETANSESKAIKHKPGAKGEGDGKTTTTNGNPKGEQKEDTKGHKQRLTLMDNHSGWRSTLAERDQVEATVRATLQDVVADVGAENIPEHLRGTLQTLWALTPDQSAGDSPGDDGYELKGGRRGQIDWVRLLRRYIGQTLAVTPDFCWPPRRFPELVGVVPGRRRRGHKPNIMAVIDTSSSITAELLERINAELARLADDYSITVVECDTRIQRTYAYKPIHDVQGGGGTDLRPPFAREFLQRHRPDLVVYFTDGEGPAPKVQPRIKVVWCLTPRGVSPRKWGLVIRMEDTSTQEID